MGYASKLSLWRNDFEYRTDRNIFKSFSVFILLILKYFLKIFGIIKKYFYICKIMKKRRNYYQELKISGLTDEEIAESFIFSIERNKEEKKEDENLLKEYINKNKKKNEKT